jgi:GH24 family phage-related lysozyme (muramidase)
MKIGKAGIELIKSFEGLVLYAYQCPAKVWTIGYGHTGKVNGKPIKKGMKITKEQAEELLLQDIVKFEKKVSKYDKKYKWTQNEFDSLVSFAFNIGSIDQLTALGTRSKSTIACKILLYNKSAGRVLTGLMRRREIERLLFLK